MEIAVVVGAYLLGSLPTALLLVRRITGEDVRRSGSGNVGATNATRLAGWRVGIAVTIVDVGKGVLPVMIMGHFHPASRWLAATMLAAVLGHCFPVWLKFRGGKGVATGLGAFLVIAPIAAAAAVGVWILVLWTSRFVALASMLASATFPVILFFIDRQPPIIMTAVSAAAMLIIVRHSSNIRNLIAGREPRIGKDGPESGGNG